MPSKLNVEGSSPFARFECKALKTSRFRTVGQSGKSDTKTRWATQGQPWERKTASSRDGKPAFARATAVTFAALF